MVNGRRQKSTFAAGVFIVWAVFSCSPNNCKFAIPKKFGRRDNDVPRPTFLFRIWRLTSNPYQVLGVTRDATQNDIKRAYRAKAAVLHPVHSGNPDAFAELANACEVLGDPERKSKYDETEQAGLDERSAIITSSLEALAVQSFESAGNPVQWICETVNRQRSCNRSDAERTRIQVAPLEERLRLFVESNYNALEAFEVIKNSIEAKIKLLRIQAEELENQVERGKEILTYLNGLSQKSAVIRFETRGCTIKRICRL